MYLLTIYVLAIPCTTLSRYHFCEPDVKLDQQQQQLYHLTTSVLAVLYVPLNYIYPCSMYQQKTDLLLQFYVPSNQMDLPFWILCTCAISRSQKHRSISLHDGHDIDSCTGSCTDSCTDSVVRHCIHQPQMLSMQLSVAETRGWRIL